jgi:hypothetical protein
VDNLLLGIVTSPCLARKPLRGGAWPTRTRSCISPLKSPAWVNHYVSRTEPDYLNRRRRDLPYMTTLVQKLSPYSLFRLISGLCLAAVLVAGSALFVARPFSKATVPESLVQLTDTSPEALLADTLGSQVSSLANAVSAYQASHGLYSTRTVTFAALLADNFLTHVPLPPLAASTNVYQFDPATSRITLPLDGSAGARICEAINRRGDGHCVNRRGRPEYWEDVGPTGGFTASLDVGPSI